ncbi:hypothetical protein [Nocardia arthritidis]|uniref:hypothetical protein n=1 Tax=Nocardia arthritidis TaxID=228602 RepID=UPI0007A4B6EB|nr:hypothetical protein [Nocardia arthritidis]
MVERRILDAAGPARLLVMLALLAGVVVMHSAVFGSSGHVHAGAHAAPALASATSADGRGRDTEIRATSGHEVARSSHATSDGSEPATSPQRTSRHDATRPHYPTPAIGAATLPHCAGGGCDGSHSALHNCVFILTGLIALAALVLLYRMAVDRPGGAAARHWRARRERPPPWTVLTLAELAILRI